MWRGGVSVDFVGCSSINLQSMQIKNKEPRYELRIDDIHGFIFRIFDRDSESAAGLERASFWG